MLNVASELYYGFKSPIVLKKGPNATIQKKFFPCVHSIYFSDLNRKLKNLLNISRLES